ncbi:MAG: hypothetical protein AAFV78_02755 [Bacteroidota bacterium]
MIFPLKRGSVGPEVKDLQRFLNLTQTRQLDVDGKFGGKTEKALEQSRAVVMSPLDLQVSHREYVRMAAELRKKGISRERERIQGEGKPAPPGTPGAAPPSVPKKSKSSQRGIWIGLGFGLMLTGLVLSTVDFNFKKKKR